MNNKENISNKVLQKQKLREIRLKKLADNLKSNIIKRKKNILKKKNG